MATPCFDAYILTKYLWDQSHRASLIDVWVFTQLWDKKNTIYSLTDLTEDLTQERRTNSSIKNAVNRLEEYKLIKSTRLDLLDKKRKRVDKRNRGQSVIRNIQLTEAGYKLIKKAKIKKLTSATLDARKTSEYFIEKTERTSVFTVLVLQAILGNRDYKEVHKSYIADVMGYKDQTATVHKVIDRIILCGILYLQDMRSAVTNKIIRKIVINDKEFKKLLP